MLAQLDIGLNAGLKTGCQSEMAAENLHLLPHQKGICNCWESSLDSMKTRLYSAVYSAEHQNFEPDIIAGPANDTLSRGQAPMTASLGREALASACCSRNCSSLALQILFLLIIFSSFSSLQLPTRSFVSVRAARVAAAACFSSLVFGVWSFSSGVRLR